MREAGCKKSSFLSLPSLLVLAGALLFSVAPAFSQAKLRLSDSTVGPVSIATGANGATQTIEAYNLGTGSLALSLSSNATWLTASAGASRACQIVVQQPLCIPINFAFNTAALAKGTYTATVTVRDPNALDAPQTISVTAQVGGGIPDTVFLYSTPGGSADSFPFATNSTISAVPATQTGSGWLSVAYEGQGSFKFVQPYRISANPGTLAEGNYNGTVLVNGSSFAADNKTVQVRFVVTSQPIVFAAPAIVTQKVVQNGSATVVNIGLGNRGKGTLALNDATATVTNGTGWLSVAKSTTFLGAAVTLTPGSLAPGTYRGTVTLTTNAINSPSLAIPVEMEVVAAATPSISYSGVRNNANFKLDDPLGVGTIAALFGEFLTDNLYFNTSLTLPTTLGGARVLINGAPAPLYFASPGQINFQVPYETLGGQAIIQVERNGVLSNRAAVTIAPQAARILVWPGLQYGIIVNADGTLPLPTTIKLGTYTSKPVKVGDTLVIYAIGFGQTTPAVASGQAAPSSPLAQLSGVMVRFGAPGSFGSTIAVPPLFAGLSPGFVGLYQINVQVPENIPSIPDLDLGIDYQGQISNLVKIAVQ